MVKNFFLNGSSWPRLSLIFSTLFFASILPSYAYAAVETFESDAGHAGTTVDGWLQRIDESSWAVSHDAATADIVHEDTTNETISSYNEGGSVNGISRWGATFDTSTLPDDAVIDSVEWCLYITAKGDARDDSVVAVTFNPAADGNLDASDYDMGDFGTTALATVTDLSTISTSAYHCFVLNATGEAAVSLTGITKLGLRMQSDVDNSLGAAAGSNYLQWNSADNGTNIPYLEVTYTVGGGGTSGGGGSGSGNWMSSGSLVIYHNACTDWEILSGSSSGAGFTFDSCVAWDTSVEISFIAMLKREAAHIIFSTLVLAFKWFMSLTMIFFVARWLFRIVTRYKAPHRRRR